MMLPGILRHRAAKRGAASAVPAAETSKSAFDIIKWVIPSVGAFAALVGWVAESAHQGLLGVDRGDLGATAYVWSAGQFLSSVMRAVSSAAFLPRFFSAHSSVELWLLAVTLGVGVTLYVIRRAANGETRPPLFRRILFTSLLMTLVIWRLLTIEVPLARIENLLVGGTRVVEDSLRYDKVTSAEQAILKRSVVFYSLLLCERRQDARVQALRLTCQQEQEYSTDSVRLMLVAICISIAMLGIITLLWSRASTTTVVVLLAPVALYCCLAPAWVYGKLVKPPTFESALIQVKTGLEQMPAQTAFNGRPAVENNTAGRLLTAIILGHDDKMFSLYVSQSKACGASPPTYEWVPWQIPISEVVAMREIQSLDVISERFKQVPCPDSALPP
jgi:hypothetical protein